MKKMKHLLFALVLIAGNSQASLVNLSINGVVDAATNWGGLSVGDNITADLVLDISGYTGSGLETFYFTGSNTLDVTAGAFSYDQSMDSALNASVTFNNGDLYDLNFGAQYGVNSAPEDFDSFFTNVLANRDLGYKVKGTPQFANLAAHWEPVTLTAVPVPAAVWLFGSGLLGLAGIARRKKA